MSIASNNNIAEAIYLSLKDKNASEFGQSMSNIIKFLIRKRLLPKSKDILIKLEEVINKKEGIILAKVSSTDMLSEDIKNNLSAILQKKYKATKVLLENNIDQKLLGGLKIKVNDEIIDMSIQGKLIKLQEHLTR